MPAEQELVTHARYRSWITGRHRRRAVWIRSPHLIAWNQPFRRRNADLERLCRGKCRISPYQRICPCVAGTPQRREPGYPDAPGSSAQRSLRRSQKKKSSRVVDGEAMRRIHAPRPSRGTIRLFCSSDPRHPRSVVRSPIEASQDRRVRETDHRSASTCSSWRSCTRESRSRADVAPTRAMNMSHCVSHTSPWVPRKASAAEPPRTAASHSISS